MIPLVALACRSGGGLIVLMGCHVISRAIYFGLCFLFGRSRYRFSLQGVTKQDVNWGLRSSVAIGTIGLLVGGYEILDILLLSKLASFSELAYYSAAQRLIWPTLMAVAAVGGTFYPVIASYWPQDRIRFEEACQRGLDTVLVLGGFALCSVFAAAEFFMGLLGPELANGAPVLRVLALLCFVKAITSTVGPVLYVVKAQRQALQFIGIAVAAKAAVIAILTPRYGYMGVAFGALIAETFFAAVPAIYLIRKLSGYRVRWSVPLRVAMITMVAAVVPWLLSVKGFPAALAAPGLYVPLAFLSGALRLSEVQSLLKWKTP
jgi:O-antigen/teichoic acid export membrane protein